MAINSDQTTDVPELITLTLTYYQYEVLARLLDRICAAPTTNSDTIALSHISDALHDAFIREIVAISDPALYDRLMKIRARNSDEI